MIGIVTCPSLLEKGATDIKVGTGHNYKLITIIDVYHLKTRQLLLISPLLLIHIIDVMRKLCKQRLINKAFCY